MTTSGDNIPNGFCQTANPQCAMPTRRGSWICWHLGLARHMTPNRTAAHRKADRRRSHPANQKRFWRDLDDGIRWFVLNLSEILRPDAPKNAFLIGKSISARGGT
jgi:hypothetical protein